MKRLLALLCALLFLTGPALAQVFPTRGDTPVTDDADMIPPVAEAELAGRLVAARQDHGVEIAVVTLISSALYTGGEEIGDYARLLTEEWMLGSTTDDKAVMLLVLRDDRDLHLWVSGGMGDQSAVTDAIVANVILPAFRQDDYVGGITAGVDAVLTRIVAPEPAAEPAATGSAPATEGEGGGTALYWIGGIVAAAIAAIVGMNRRSAAKLAATPCPACGKTGLSRERVTTRAATETAEGAGEVRTSCPSCGHTTTEPFTIPKRTKAKTAEKTDGKGSTGSW
jgi:uncharacterized protein